MLNSEIKNKVQTLWDRLWAEGLSNPITAIEQISYLLFMKRLENFIPNIENDYKWSHYSQFEGKKILDHVKNKVFTYIKNDLSSADEPFAQAMFDAVFSINKPELLKDSMKIIDSIYIDIDKEITENNQHFHDIQGDVFEHLLQHTSEAGKNGQFRTPRHIIHMMCEILDPDLDGKICDIASGTGGFLVGAYQYLVTKNSELKEPDDDGLLKGIDGKKLSEQQKENLSHNTFFGFDVSPTMVRIGVMNMMMHGISKPNLANLDSLSNSYEEFEASKLGIEIDLKDKESLTNPLLQGQYKYILANPPFTGKINSTGISENIDRTYPPQYDKEGRRKKQTVQSELLFLERIVYMLSDGGKAAVIVPEGVLFNSGKSHKAIREILMTDCDLESVISLPSGVFLPYTGVKTSILIFKKRKFKNGIDKGQNIDVWFYGMESDGYSLDSNRKRLKETPLPEVISRWINKKKESQTDRKLVHFSVPFDEIKKNGFELNFNLYQDFVYIPQEFEPSEQIIKKIEILEKEVQQSFEDLKKYM